jgi:ferredoxin
LSEKEQLLRVYKESSVAAKAEWYYARHQRRIGPLTSAQLRELAAAGALSPADMVFRTGMRQWVAAGTVKGLFPPNPAPTAVEEVPYGLPPTDGPARNAEFASRHEALSEGQVVPDAVRCVQCGCCSYNCPIGIDVRAHAWRGLPVHDSHCLTCGECVRRCPRGVLSFERIGILGAES